MVLATDDFQDASSNHGKNVGRMVDGLWRKMYLLRVSGVVVRKFVESY